MTHGAPPRRAARRTWALFLLVAATSPGCGAARSAPPSGATFGSGFVAIPASPRAAQLEPAMFERINQDRASEGKAPLVYDDRLADIARAHSADMRDHGFFDHVSPTTGTLDDRLARAGYLMRRARENLAEAIDVGPAEDGLLASPHHHENLMATDVTHVGVGIVEGGVQDANNLTFTQVFATPAVVETVAQGRAAVAQAIAAARSERGLAPARPHARLDELAAAHLAELPDDPRSSDLGRIGKAISEELGKTPIPGIRGVAVSGQVLPDSTEFEPGDAMLRPDVAHYGLAAGEARGPGGRPMLKLLLVVGL
jgi:uncharacterized protein YkwD